MVSASSIEREVQDYLDERLTPHERIAFEERMRVDPRLSLRVQAAKELGTLLREDPGALSAGFYARARRRFEESAGEGRRGGFRLLSWEAAGLAAAAALVMALFIPHFVREGAPEPGRPASGPQAPQGGFANDAPTSEPVRPPTPRPQTPSAMQAKPASPPEEKKGDRGAAAPSGTEDAYAPVPPKARHDEADPESFTPLGAPRERENDVADDAFAPAPQAGEVELAGPKSPAAMQERSLGKTAAQSLRAAPAHRAPFAPTTVSLPRGIVAPGAVRIEEPQAWEALLRGEAGPALAALGPADTERRLVLIGERHDLDDCSALVVVETAEAWELRYHPAERAGLARAASGGCALALPGDRKVVRVAGPP